MIKLLLTASTFLVLQGQATYNNDVGIIGVRLSVLSNTVSLVHPGTPAEEVGLKKGDVILDVDGKADGEITGEPDTPVTCRGRPGGNLRDFWRVLFFFSCKQSKR